MSKAMANTDPIPRRVGVVGFGELGQFLVQKIIESTDYELVFVWNRTYEKLTGVPLHARIRNLSEIENLLVDTIIEVAHPDITLNYGADFIRKCDYIIGSPSVLANDNLRQTLLITSASSGHGIYVPSGALWGGEDIRKMADISTLSELTVTMIKHPSALHLLGELQEQNNAVTNTAKVLYDGPVRQLCALAPNNVNTMAAAAVAGHNLGFDKVKGILISDPGAADFHEVRIEVRSKKGFHCNTIKRNPAAPGAVTGMATFDAFYMSLRQAKHKGAGLHLC